MSEEQIREFQVREIADLRQEIAVLKQQIVGLESARELQAAEYARRLEELKHVALLEQRTVNERVQVQLSQSLGRGDYERRHDELVDRIERTAKEQQIWRDSVMATISYEKGRAAAVASLSGLGASLVVGAILHFLK